MVATAEILKKKLKMTEKLPKNLQDSNKSSIFAPEIAQDVPKMVFEVCSATPCDKWKPMEAMGIREMLIRSERGQRLDVHTRFRAEGIPDNMYQAKYDAKGCILPDENEETFDHTPPDGVDDIVDVIRLQEETNNRKEELRKKRKKSEEESKKREEAKASRPDNTQEKEKTHNETKKEDERGSMTSKDE